MKISPTLLKNLKKTFPPLINATNLWAYEDNALIGLDLQFSKCFEITPPNLLIVSEDTQEQFFGAIKQVLHGLKVGVVVQFWQQIGNGDDERIDLYEKDASISDDDKLAHLILKNKINYLRQAGIKNKKTYMFLTTLPSAKKKKSLGATILSSTFAKNADIDEKTHIQRVRELNEIVSPFVTGINSVGIKSRELPKEEILTMVYDYLNPGRKENLKNFPIRADLTLREQLVYNAGENHFDHLYIDGYYYRTVNLYARPKAINFDDLVATLRMLSPVCDISITLALGNQDILQKDLQSKANIAKGVAASGFFVKNYTAMAKSADVHALIEDVNSTAQKFFEYGLSIILRERTLEKLTEKTNKALLAIRNFGEADGIIDDMNHLRLFLSVLPNHSSLNPRKQTYQTEAVARMLPFSTDWVGSPFPHMVFQTEDNQLIFFDPFDDTMQNFNGVVVGVPGSGKSFLTNFVLTNFFIKNKNNHIVIIDVGGSYRKFCELFGGSYFAVSFDEKYAINVFPPKEFFDTCDPETKSETLNNIKLIIRRMLQLDAYDNDQEVVVNRAIEATYEYCQHESPLLKSLVYQLKEMSKDKDADEVLKNIAGTFSRQLQLFVEGDYAKIFNRPSQLDLSNRLIVFDLQNLNDERAQSVIFFVIQMAIMGKMNDRSLRKMIIMDEAWRFINDDTGAELVTNLYRTARKFGAGIYTISQNPNDFIDSKAGAGIMGCLSIVWLLKMTTGTEVLHKYRLSPQEVDQVASLISVKRKYSQVFLKVDSNSRVVRVEPNDLEYWICTTDARDMVTEKEFRDAHPDYTSEQILAGLAQARAIDKTKQGEE
jgi:type IV secretory pathway VirB4 component